VSTKRPEIALNCTVLPDTGAAGGHTSGWNGRASPSSADVIVGGMDEKTVVASAAWYGVSASRPAAKSPDSRGFGFNIGAPTRLISIN
jgi:hypothetical protein